MSRTCADCGADISDRTLHAHLCHECSAKRIVARSKAWYNAHADLTLERQRAWKRANPERHNANNAKWRERNPRRRAQFTHCQMPDCGRPLEARRRLWCSRCAPFVKATNIEAWRQRHKKEVNAKRRERRAA